ncbi:low-density lipoprotein receptor class A domain-containing protein 1 [Elysia marginata]|uniref:Low-density lipoprotein receptor class A domain-containing protein 1 n=1 Tax=Elysia marginata TaxID=1093978 RepID=A0AAV4FVP1_9GAST|nr:low-density lipoprotein receptor class A domain-containing protein 1 [Elysia marginata]
MITICSHDLDIPLADINFCKINEFMCKDQRTCIQNKNVCDGVTNCKNNEDENPDLCKVEIQSDKLPVSPSEPWSATCTAKLGEEIMWYLTFDYEDLHFNGTQRIHTKECRAEKPHRVNSFEPNVVPTKRPEDNCHYIVTQWEDPRKRTIVSRLEITRELDDVDYGFYHCEMLRHRSKRLHVMKTSEILYIRNSSGTLRIKQSLANLDGFYFLV